MASYLLDLSTTSFEYRVQMPFCVYKLISNLPFIPRAQYEQSTTPINHKAYSALENVTNVTNVYSLDFDTNKLLKSLITKYLSI